MGQCLLPKWRSIRTFPEPFSPKRPYLFVQSSSLQGTMELTADRN